MPAYVYILESKKSGRYYIGSANDPQRRLIQHNSNAVKATRNKGPWRIIKVIEFSDPIIARKAEYHLKRQKNRKAVAMILNNEYVWPELRIY